MDYLDILTQEYRELNDVITGDVVHMTREELYSNNNIHR